MEYAPRMKRKATATFVLDSFDHAPYDEAEGAVLGKARITKTFTGEVEGTSGVEMLGCHNADGPAAYVALERLQVRLHGRAGTFVLQHWAGTGVDGAPGMHLTVVPGTGTGELAGITGSAAIRVADGVHTFEIEYAVGG